MRESVTLIPLHTETLHMTANTVQTLESKSKHQSIQFTKSNESLSTQQSID